MSNPDHMKEPALTRLEERTTRRNPEMEQFIELRPVVVDGFPDAHALRLKVGVQSFAVNDYCEDMEHALWMRDMLCIALAKIVAQSQGPVGTGSYTSLLEENKRMREALEMFVHDWHKTGNPIKAYLLARSLTQGESNE